MVAELVSGERSHVLSCFPTGSGKSLPMLAAALLMPPGKQIVCLRLSLQRFILFTTLCEGSISMLVVPLTTKVGKRWLAPSEIHPCVFNTSLSIPYVWYQAPCCPLTMLFACVTSKKRPKLTVNNPPLPLPREVLRLTQKVRCRKWTLFWIQVRLHNWLSCELTYIFLLDYNYSPSS